MSAKCYDCGLPDPCHGGGDGIGSCDCPRCECCGAEPDGCECSHYDDYYDEAVPSDYLCGNSCCPYLLARMARARLADLGQAHTDGLSADLAPLAD